MKVREKQHHDPILSKILEVVRQQKVEVFFQEGDGVRRYQGRLCVPNIDGLRERKLVETHSLRYSIHPNTTKMYRNLQEIYWGINIKRDIDKFVAKCPNCQ